MQNIQDEFIATVSHEMRTPLTSIRGFSQTLLSSWDKIDEDNKKKFVKIIEEQSNRLINLVENILTVSKINTDKPIFKAVDVNISIEKVIQLLNIKYKNRKITSKYKSGLPFAKLDDEKFQQVIMNLVDNACKYSDEGQEIIIETGLGTAEDVIIKVIDKGVGIKTIDFDKVFEKFTRLENHLTSKTQGNGLGLYITKNLVEQMQGKIWFESVENVGTTFFVGIPIYNQEEALKCSQQS